MTRAAEPPGQHLAIAFDQAYLPWGATLIQSHLVHHPRASSFHVLHGGDLSRAERHQLSLMADEGGGRIVYHHVGGARLESLPPIARFGRVAWMRIFLPELLPDLDRILYLDADTFVTGRLDELWETPLEGAPLAAVPNVVEPAMRSHIAGLGLGTGPASFFNSGVLLLNLEVMRADHSIEAVLRTARDLEGRLVWPDQDALNVAFANRWLPLHPRWNAQNSYWTWSTWAGEVVGDDALREATEDPAIRHFEGPTINKPWHYLCAHPWRGEYRRVLATTPWAGTPLVDRTAATMLIRRFPRSAQARAYLRLERCRARFKRSSITERGPGARGTSRRWRPGRRRG